MKPVSARRARRDRDYPRLREAVYLRAQGRCEAPRHASDCSGRCEQVHHKAGRQGDNPHAMSNLIGLSRACHEQAHARKQWAIRHGISASRHGGPA